MNLNNDVKYDIEYLLDKAYNSFTLNKGKIKLVRPIIENKDRKSYIVNFKTVCNSINRKSDTVQSFLQKELQIDTSIKDDGRLKIDKTLKKTLIEGHFKNYIIEHVMCKSCKSIKTHNEKNGRIEYLICDMCKCKIAINRK